LDVSAKLPDRGPQTVVVVAGSAMFGMMVGALLANVCQSMGKAAAPARRAKPAAQV
jgi:hypothetical protein